MKTIIIIGTARPVYHTEGNTTIQNTEYNVTLFGQCPANPLVGYITSFKEELRGYDHLQKIAREKYCEYFKEDLNNLISLENITMVPAGDHSDLLSALQSTLAAMRDLVKQLPADESLADYRLDLCEIAEQKAVEALKKAGWAVSLAQNLACR